MSRTHLLLLAVAALALVACGGQGSYELRWTVGCKTPGDASCGPRSGKDCSAVGIDAIRVVAGPGGASVRTSFPCYTPDEGPVGHGPGLGKGPVVLEVAALSPGGQVLSGPVRIDVVIPATGEVRVQVDVPLPPACGDGVDNDGDGLVDLFDPECKSASGTSE